MELPAHGSQRLKPHLASFQPRSPPARTRNQQPICRYVRPSSANYSVLHAILRLAAANGNAGGPIGYTGRLSVHSDPQNTYQRELPVGRSASSSWRRWAGSAIALISVILPALIVNCRVPHSRPRGATTAPTAPLTSTGRASCARPR